MKLELNDWLIMENKNSNGTNYDYFVKMCCQIYHKRLKNNFGKLIEKEEFISLCSLNLCKYWDMYEESKSDYSTFVYLKCLNTLHEVINTLNCKKRKHLFKYNTFSELQDYCSNFDDSEGYLNNIIGNYQNLYDSLEYKDVVKSITDNIKNEKHKQIFKYSLYGYSTREIAKIMGCSNALVSKVNRNIRKTLKDNEVCLNL